MRLSVTRCGNCEAELSVLSRIYVDASGMSLCPDGSGTAHHPPLDPSPPAAVLAHTAELEHVVMLLEEAYRAARDQILEESGDPYRATDQFGRPILLDALAALTQARMVLYEVSEADRLLVDFQTTVDDVADPSSSAGAVLRWHSESGPSLTLEWREPPSAAALRFILETLRDGSWTAPS